FVSSTSTTSTSPLGSALMSKSWTRLQRVDLLLTAQLKFMRNFLAPLNTENPAQNGMRLRYFEASIGRIRGIEQ
ncbi:hypothetical protein AKJ65_02120, partial [candidate division MSBL1 archaeon SCGC-AAA259E19]